MAAEPWDVELVHRQGVGTLVRVEQEGRLVLEESGKPFRVDLTWVDEAALALARAAVARGRDLTFVYPAPAGQVAVLLAAQVAISLTQQGGEAPLVGLLTADPAGATRVWQQLRIKTVGDRTPLTEFLPVWRADPSGRAPFGNRRVRGILIGRRCAGWPVTVTIIDHLAGPVDGQAVGTCIRVFADPVDPVLAEIASGPEALVWGWSDSIIALWHNDIETALPGTIPFSVANDRLAAMGRGIDIRTVVVRHEEAEHAIERLREDLLALTRVVGSTPEQHITLGLRLAWSHAQTLGSLPCLPSFYDRFAGLPPRAARPTAGFAREMKAWADSLEGDIADYVAVVATDLADLRAALEKGNPVQTQLTRLVSEGKDSLFVFKTKTAATAFLEILKSGPLPKQSMPWRKVPRVSWYSRLSREPAGPEAVVVGAPPRSAWHRLDSGLAQDLSVIVIGEAEAKRVVSAAAAVRYSRARWAGLDLRERVWRALVDSSPPEPPIDVPVPVPPEIPQVHGAALHAAADAFSPLGALLRDDRPLVEEEGAIEQVARQTDGEEWHAFVDAVEVETDQGIVLLALDQEVDVLESDGEPGERLASSLRPGMRLILGREAGRVGLLDALEARLQHRPAVLGARLLLRDYKERVLTRYRESGITYAQLHRELQAVGCTKTAVAVRSWVSGGTRMAPRDYADFERLTRLLEFGWSPTRTREAFLGISRIRTFRRAAGKALLRAANAAVVADDETRIDPETGLSIADLREAVVVALVSAVTPLAQQVRLSETGRLSW